MKYKSHIAETAGREQTPANNVFIQVLVYWSVNALFVSKNEHSSGSWYNRSSLSAELYASPLKKITVICISFEIFIF